MIDLRNGDMRDVLPTLEAESVHACITDPPYHLTSGVLGFDNASLGPHPNAGKPRPTGFMGKHWDGGSIAFDADTWRAVHRVLKPGGYLLAMGGTRTFHRLACAIEDAGFEVRDTIAWVYGSGFPKSLDISKAIDRAAGAEREVVGPSDRHGGGSVFAEGASGFSADVGVITAPATAAARQWNGWGTALKPSIELVCVARKPLSERTVAGNVLRHGTGGINVDACRIEASPGDYDHPGDSGLVNRHDGRESWRLKQKQQPPSTLGRWPANLCHDGSPEVEAAFAAFGERTGFGGAYGGTDPGMWAGKQRAEISRHNDTGTASRFFYTAKADKGDRADSRHPTVKPVDLIRWLVRMVTPRNGTVLDPFAGSGTTGEAAMLEGFNAILIEREAEHAADIAHRQRRWHGGDLPLFAEAAD